MTTPIEVEVLFNPSISPVFITATNMLLPISTISLSTIKNNLKTIMITVIESNIYYSILSITLLVYVLYKLKKFI
jgi:hypothetical protein